MIIKRKEDARPVVQPGFGPGAGSSVGSVGPAVEPLAGASFSNPQEAKDWLQQYYTRRIVPKTREPLMDRLERAELLARFQRTVHANDPQPDREAIFNGVDDADDIRVNTNNVPKRYPITEAMFKEFLLTGHVKPKGLTQTRPLPGNYTGFPDWHWARLKQLELTKSRAMDLALDGLVQNQIN